MRRFATFVALAGLVLFVGAQRAHADSIGFHVTGTFSSVDNPGDDPVIAATDPALGDPWALQLTFTQGQFGTTADVSLTFDTYTFTFANTATSGTMLFDGNTENGSVEFDGSGTAPLLQINYNDPNDSLNNGYLDLFLSGNAATADDLLGASLTGDNSATGGGAFDFLNNFDTDPQYQDMSDQTELMGATDAGPFSGRLQAQPVNTVPEPASLWLLATGLLGLGGLMWRQRSAGEPGA